MPDPYFGGEPGFDEVLRMVRAAIAGNDRFECSRVELDRQGPSYTVDTLRYFKTQHPNARLNLIVGADNTSYIKEWHESEELLKLCRLLVAPRPAKMIDCPPDGPGGVRAVTAVADVRRHDEVADAVSRCRE